MIPVVRALYVLAIIFAILSLYREGGDTRLGTLAFLTLAIAFICDQLSANARKLD